MKKKLTVAFQGEKGAFSEAAAKNYFAGHSLAFKPYNTFEQAFQSVKRGTVDFGVIPFENSLTGSILENYDLLVQHKGHIQGEIKLRISHCLIANKNVKLGDIRKVISHPQALSQCKNFLKTLKKAEAVPFYDTAGSVKQVMTSGTTDTAAIAGKQAAHDYGMKILKRGIENNKLNFTRFLIIGKKPATAASGANKTSIVFAPKRDIPGVLFRALSVFALRDINLLKIESRPLAGSPWQHIFYLDFTGSMQDEAAQKAIEHLREITTSITILGSYQQGRDVKNW